MYNSFVSAIAMSYKKIKHLHLGHTYTIGFRGRRTIYNFTTPNCITQQTIDHCYFGLNLCFSFYMLF